MEEQERRVGRRTDAEIKAEAVAEVSDELAKMREEMESLRKQTTAQVATVKARGAVDGTIPSLRKKRVNINNDIVRGVAHATGGASHEPLEDGTPWTPACPDWVYESFGGRERNENDEMVPATEEGALAEYIFKQAYLDDIKIVDLDMLNEAIANYKEGKELVPVVEAVDAQELAKAAVL